MSTALRVLLVLAVLGAAAGCASNPGRTAGEKVDDALTTAGVKAKLAEEKLSTLTRVGVETHQGVVTLKGVVESEDVRQRAADAASRVGGVRTVINNLTVDTSPRAPVVTPPVTSSPSAGGVLDLDKENRWRAGADTLDGTLTEVRQRAMREAALQNRAVAYESVDGFQRVEAYPLAGIGPGGCRQVQERIYQNGQIAQDQATEVCR